MNGIRLDNYYICLHLDKSDISVKARPENNDQTAQHVPILAQSMAVCLHGGQVREGRLRPTEYGWQRKLLVEYATGRITIRYDKIFRNRPATEGKRFKTYPLIHITIENYAKLDYSHHHYVCKVVDACLDQHWITRDHHIRRAELAGDSLDRVIGEFLAMAMVPYDACTEGWECKSKSPQHPNGLKRKQWIERAEGQYYWGRKTDVDKDRKNRRREWNPHVHWYGSIPIWRIELRLGRKYLWNKDRKIRTHAQLLDQMVDLYTHNVRFRRPRLEDIRKFLFKCRQGKKHPKFTAKSWSTYLEWEKYSTCAWMDDLQKRIGTPVSRFFHDVEYPEIYTGERLIDYNYNESGHLFVPYSTC